MQSKEEAKEIKYNTYFCRKILYPYIYETFSFGGVFALIYKHFIDYLKYKCAQFHAINFMLVG